MYIVFNPHVTCICHSFLVVLCSCLFKMCADVLA